MNPVRNEELKNAIKTLKQDSSTENYVEMLNQVVRARLIIPVYMDRKPEYDEKLREIVLEKDTEISFELIKSEKGNLYYPVFTDGAELRVCIEDKDQQSLIVNFDDLAALTLQPQSPIDGFVINPMSDDVRFSAEMISAMKENMEKEDAGNK